MENVFLGVVKDLVSTGQLAFEPLLIALCLFLLWRVSKIEKKLDNGLVAKLSESRELMYVTHAKLEDIKVTEEKCQKQREEFEKEQANETVKLLQRVLILEEHERMA